MLKKERERESTDMLNKQKERYRSNLGRDRGQMVCVLAYYSEDPCLHLNEVYSLFVGHRKMSFFYLPLIPRIEQGGCLLLVTCYSNKLFESHKNKQKRFHFLRNSFSSNEKIIKLDGQKGLF